MVLLVLLCLLWTSNTNSLVSSVCLVRQVLILCLQWFDMIDFSTFSGFYNNSIDGLDIAKSVVGWKNWLIAGN